MRTCFFAFAAFVVASLAMLSNTSPPAFAVAVGPPSVSITSPSDGDVIPLNTVITFSGIGTDSDGTLLVRGQLFWSSSQNGFLGTGPGFTRNSSTLSLGSHTIGLLATGGNNMQNFASVTIWIGPPPTATPTNTPTAVPTNTPTRTPVPPTSTNTPVPPTSTSTPLPPTSTSTSVPATSTRAPATSTNTPVPPTSTATRTVAPSATSTPPVTSTPSTARRCADFNGDGRVSWRDVFIIAEAVGHHTHDLRFDVNGNGRVGWGDVWATMWQVGRRCGDGPVTTPTHAPEPTSTPTLAVASPRTGDASATPTETPLPLD